MAKRVSALAAPSDNSQRLTLLYHTTISSVSERNWYSTTTDA